MNPLQPGFMFHPLATQSRDLATLALALHRCYPRHPPLGSPALIIKGKNCAEKKSATAEAIARKGKGKGVSSLIPPPFVTDELALGASYP